ncbi:MAG: glutamine-hydrolyzing carbamoyl-phosphate synthase small subunit [Candidatus Altiarchaeota archaeon]
MVKGVLVLKDGTIVEGTGFGAEGEVKGEVVFNTSMAGYQESLTDPSYRYQILMPTYPLIGNYGINDEDFESDRVQVEGYIVGEYCEKPSHYKQKKTVNEFLKDYGVPGLYGVDTRFLTRKIRTYGVIEGILKWPVRDSEKPSLVRKAEKLKSISEYDLIKKVTCRDVVEEGKGKRVVLIDCGAKRSIIRKLLERGLQVVRVPATMSSDDILKLKPAGVVLSNGPGDPERADYVIKTVRALADKNLPLFGICLGIQMIALAFGGKTFKLKFGHRGMNQPVKDLDTGSVYITSQNHGFAVDAGSIEGTGLRVSHINLNDNTVEGLRHKTLPVLGVQYHPEASSGPWDNYYLFDEFMRMIK